MAFHPYLFFGGNCREAFTRYQEIFGGELFVLTMKESGEEVPPGMEDMVIHAAITIGDDLLMASDDPTEDGFGPVQGMQVTYATDDPADAKKVFDALAEGGEVRAGAQQDVLLAGLRHVRRQVRDAVDGQHEPSPRRADRRRRGPVSPCRAVADGLDVVAVGVAHEGAVVVGVVLGPDAGLVQHLGAGRRRRRRRRRGRWPGRAPRRRCATRGSPSPESNRPSQKSGFGGMP